MRWNQYRGDSANSGVARSGSAEERPSVAWTADLEGTPRGSPVFDRDAVVVGTDAGVFAYDRKTGAYQWPVRTDSPATTPVCARGVIAVVTRGGAVYGLDADTGDEHWTSSVPGPVTASPSEHDGTVFVGHDAGVTAFEVATGERVWAVETDEPTVGAPAIDADHVYVGTRDDQVHAFARDPVAESEEANGNATGTGVPDGSTHESTPADSVSSSAAEGDDDNESDPTVWSVPVEGALASGPSLFSADGGDRIYSADDGGLVLAMDARTGQSWFTYEIRDAFTSAPTIRHGDETDDDTLFVAADDAYLHVTDTQFGTRQVRGWLFAKKGISLDGVALTDPVLVGDALVVGDDRGSIYGIDIEALDFAWHQPVESGVTCGPAVGADGLFVGTDDGRLIHLS